MDRSFPSEPQITNERTLTAMHGTLFGVALAVALLLNSGMLSAQQLKSARSTIEHIAQHANGKIGVAVVGLENNDTLTFNGKDRFPTMSVYKFPLAVAILAKVDKGEYTLDQSFTLKKEDIHPDTWSPLREKYPNRSVTLRLDELLTYMITVSDNNCCDYLFRLAGGPGAVEAYIHSLGVMDMKIVATEEEMGKDPRSFSSNWSSPSAMCELLKQFRQGKILSEKSRGFLWDTMVKTSTGPGRIKGLLPAGTVVAHKTGSSGTDKRGITPATNDVGIITLPDGNHIAVAVFVSDSRDEEQACENIIARVARAVWDSYSVR